MCVPNNSFFYFPYPYRLYAGLFGVSIRQALFIAPCSHTFHYKCIRPLLESHHPAFSCPLCRTFADLDEDVEVEADPFDDGDDSAVEESVQQLVAAEQLLALNRLPPPVFTSADREREREREAGAETEVETDAGAGAYGSTLRNARRGRGGQQRMDLMDEADEHGQLGHTGEGEDEDMIDAHLRGGNGASSGEGDDDVVIVDSGMGDMAMGDGTGGGISDGSGEVMYGGLMHHGAESPDIDSGEGDEDGMAVGGHGLVGSKRKR